MSEATTLYALRRIYEGIRKRSEFGSFQEFCDWAEGKYQKGFTVYRRDQTKPYSPENCYWYYAIKKVEEVTSPICEGCTEDMTICGTIGCLRYREYFVTNWNENIRIKPKEVPVPKSVKEFFRYEHPDLQREGIVWQGLHSEPPERS